MHRPPPPFEVAEIGREYGEVFRATHPVSHEQARVLRAIAQCRTAALGGHVEVCEACGTERVCYDSCRNRHCPKCQGAARAKWLAAEQALLLPVPYFHLVFTLPHTLNPLVRVNQRALYHLLFQAATQTLQEFARDPQHLGAELGITAVLHTWGQTLTEHIPVHCVVTGGGLSAEGTRWRAGRRRFLFAVKALSQVFRGKYLAGLRRLRSQHQLTFAGESAEWVAEAAWTKFLHQLQARAWVVYAKPPWGGPEQVLRYLSRYTHRVAISNQRLVFVGDGIVRFRYQRLRGRGHDQGHGNARRGIPTPLSPPCRPAWLRPHPPLRAARQPRPLSQTHPLSSAPRGRGRRGDFPPTCRTPRIPARQCGDCLPNPVPDLPRGPPAGDRAACSPARDSPMSPEPRCTFLCWFLSLLAPRCSEPSALVCPLPALRPSPPPPLVSRPASLPSSCAFGPSPSPFSCSSQRARLIGRLLPTR